MALSCGCWNGLFGRGRHAHSSVPDASPRRNGTALPQPYFIKPVRCEQWATPVNDHSPAWTRATSDGSTRSNLGAYSTNVELRGWTEEAEATHGDLTKRRRLGDAGEVSIWSSNGQQVQTPHSGASFGLEQLLSSPGSLPRGMTSLQRRETAARAVHTATFERMSQIPPNVLRAKGPEGQSLRRKMLHGTVIVFFTAGYEGKRFVYERAHELGVRSVIIDSPDSWSRKLVDEGLVERFIPIDMSTSSDAVYDEALRAIQQLGDTSVGKASGVATVVELSVPVVARLAETLGLPGHLPDSVDRARDKCLTREALRAAGLPTPAFYHIHNADDLERAAMTVGFPAVLKPISGAASLGVKKVSAKEELFATYEEVFREVRSLVVSSGALVKDSGDGVGVNASSVIDTSFLLEQYLDGDEVDVDVVMSEGEWQYAAVSDNGPTLEPYFNETWAVSPSLLPREKQVELKELAINSLKALSFDSGVFHVECKYTTKNGPQLIEVNARMGGGPVYKTNLRTWNVCLVEETLLASIGVPSRPDVPKQPLVCVANSDVNALRSGTLLDMSFLEPLMDREGVVSFDPHVCAGERIVGPQEGLPTWLVEIVVSKPTAKEAYHFLLQLEAEVQARVLFL
mmetsp:Transcript_9028/g.23582  ORF Transcript_9028/g.23582 Transcript_9028/m.23582 type:complete len:627 (+) Transcript_9028:51-1931(+)|eukprot:CAMPEP_0117498180 /NCGR_PEP_ID=MMETSP0784-20121206/21578_1 /TAXON_ID=39447 /ORGANISM="" /LENGTH=626 /DNA_ID=CAMNT_0005293251 /DNA_START=47 /DNA_END=1927 /DNA_ORIENTATION=+